MTVLTKIKFRNKLLLQLLLYSFTLFSQNNKPVRFRDYPFVQNLDSFERVIRTRKNNSEQYLHNLITLEKNRVDYLGWFGHDLNTIKTLAYQLRLPLAIASYNYLEGINLREQSLGKAARNTLEAIRYFEATKDTTGMIYCYYAMLYVNSNSDAYHSNKRESPQYYYDKIMNLGQKSSQVSDKLMRIRTILAFEKIVKGKQDFTEGAKEVEEALGMLKSEMNFMKTQIFGAIATFYLRHKKPQEALNYHSKAFESYKNLTSKISVKFYYNFAITHFDAKAYKESKFYVTEAINGLENLNEEERDSKNLLSAYNLLSDIQYINKDYEAAKVSKEKAFNTLVKRYALLRNSLFQELKTQQDIEQKEIENTLLIKKNELAEIKSQKLQQESEISLLFQKNKLAESQNLEYQKEIENNLLSQKNEAIESRNAQYKTAFCIGSVSFIIVCILVYFLYKANNKQKKLILFRDQLFGIIAHDMRSPLTAFKGVSDSLAFLLQKREYDSIPTLSQSIDKSIFNANLLLDNLLDWYSLQNLNTKTSKSTFSVYELVKESKDLYETVAKNQHSTIEIAVSESLNIFADRNALLLILRNLIDNALKHGQSKNILIKAQNEANYVAVEVKNNGTILSSEKLSVLQKQVKQSSVVIKEGRGLGLYLVSHFVAQHKGRLSIESSKEDGTIFKIQIPVMH